MLFHSIASSSLLTIYTTVSNPDNRTKGERHHMYIMATTTFIKRQIIWTLLIQMSSSILCCISLTPIDVDRQFNRNNILCCRTSTNTVRYASSDNSNKNINKKKEQHSLYTSQKGDTAGHMVGSSIERPIRKNDKQVTIKTYRSFKNQWLEESGHVWPSKCSTNECRNYPTVGAHIFINKKEYAYLVPMCHKCNMDRNNFVPYEIFDNHLRFPIQLDDKTPCVELTHLHISEQNTCANIGNPTWLQMLERFIAYTKKHNSPLVPYRYKNDPQLGLWVSSQRVRYKGDGFNLRQKELLESNGFVWDALEYEWDENFQLLIKYKDRKGHCNFPSNYKEDGVNLGTWLGTQRQYKKRGTLNTVKEMQLKELGVVWDVLEYEWDENIKLLIKYKGREGHCNVSYNHKEDGRNLGTWLRTQRHDKKRGTLHTKKEKQLEEIGIEWDPLEFEWDENIKLLIKYKDREGHCNVPQRHKEDGANLGMWLKTQRQNKKRGTLDTVKEKQLEELGIVWVVIEHEWNENIKLLIKYKNRQGDCNVPYNHKEDGTNLGKWLSKQRQNKKGGTLDTVKEKQLEELGFILDTLEYEWDTNFILLIKYKDREGHCNVPQRHKEDGANLGMWLHKQKYRKVNEVRQERLREIGVIWDNPRTGTIS